jgi:transcriptional regulator with XRE-family HTH domain
MTQEDLAERSGLSVDAIGLLERGDRRSPRPSTVALLATALKLDEQQREALIAAARGRVAPAVSHESMPADVLPERAALPAGSRMPLAPNPLFVGRGGELLQVARALRGGDATVALGQVVASIVSRPEGGGRSFTCRLSIPASPACSTRLPLHFSQMAGSNSITRSGRSVVTRWWPAPPRRRSRAAR